MEILYVFFRETLSWKKNRIKILFMRYRAIFCCIALHNTCKKISSYSVEIYCLLYTFKYQLFFSRLLELHGNKDPCNLLSCIVRTAAQLRTVTFNYLFIGSYKLSTFVCKCNTNDMHAYALRTSLFYTLLLFDRWDNDLFNRI